MRTDNPLKESRRHSTAIPFETIGRLAACYPANPIALALALETQGLGGEDFRLPTRALEQIDFLPGWSRQNYRTAIANAVALGLFERIGPRGPGRGGAKFRLNSGNGLVSGPVSGRAA